MEVVNITGISESRIAPYCENIIKESKGQVIIVTPTHMGVTKLAMDLSFFINKKIYFLPESEETFLGYEAKNKDNMFAYLKVLKSIIEEEDSVIITSVSSAIKKLPPKDFFLESIQRIKKAQDLNLNEFINSLINMGYERVPMVYAKGQFSLRGGILDLFTPYNENPYRIELFDTQVEEIRSFDSSSQRSVEKLTEIEIYPAQFIVKNQEIVKRAKKKIEKIYEALPQRREELIDSLENSVNTQQLEQYMEYFYDEPDFFWQYIKGDTIIFDDPNRAHEKIVTREEEGREDLLVLQEKGKFVSEDLKRFSLEKDFLKMYKWPRVFLCTPFSRGVKGIERYSKVLHVQSRQVTFYGGNIELLRKDLKRYIENSYKVTILCSTKERYKNIYDFLQREELDDKVWVKEGVLSGGMEFPEEKKCYITDGDIFGSYKKKSKRREKKTRGGKIKTFADIAKGDFVVHESHGIGKFIGLEQLTIQGEEKDFLKVKYAGDDMLYVPVDQMDLIQKYIGADAGTPKINRLNGREWRTTKAKAKVDIETMAKELLEISAARSVNHGHMFEKDTTWQREFEDAFPYEETQDQLRCINEIKQDMESELAMDRLLCGDVGYGKTEVAARAMFKCAADGKQVALLVPTTILASQHYNTLKERFERFPFKVEMLSRFRSEKEQKKIIEDLKAGQVDVIIGTHRLLSSDIHFKDLGLLIIDEEQRFGVKHKELIKQLRKNIDVLTLSATPIPRTLHMSLVGIRDMSLIEEPPEERYPVQTYVLEEDDYIIKEAIERELDRGGQVFIVYNRVRGIQKIAERIHNLVPDKKIAIGHGQMGEGSLENVMMDFINGETDILIATTIIESGIDIPNVNTAIVIDADKYGLSQLYQLRGRVGRSNKIAYAYLMHKKDKVLTEVAEKRLRAIKAFTEFGAGFKIAMRDLEIRGAGNVLGGEQHGHLVSIGYELYCKLVDEAVRELKGEDVPKKEKEDVAILIKAPAFIPGSYIENEVIKISVYKKIASIRDEEDRKDIIAELEDRFGRVPKEVLNLILVAQMRKLAENLGISKIVQKFDKVTIFYSKEKATKPLNFFIEKGKNNLLEILEILDFMAKK